MSDIDPLAALNGGPLLPADRAARRRTARAAAKNLVHYDGEDVGANPDDGRLTAVGIMVRPAVATNGLPALAFDFGLSDGGRVSLMLIMQDGTVLDRVAEITVAAVGAVHHRLEEMAAVPENQPEMIELTRGQCTGCGTPIFGDVAEVGECLTCQRGPRG